MENEQHGQVSPVRWEIRDWILLAAAALAAGCYFFAHFPYLFTDRFHLPCIGWTLTQWLLAAVTLSLAGKSGRLRGKKNPGGWFLLASGLGLGLTFSLYADEGLRAMNLPVAFLTTVLALFSLTGANPLPPLSGAGLRLGLSQFFPACFRDSLEPFRALSLRRYQKDGEKLQGLGLGLLLSIPAGIIALSLLSSADEMFSSLLKQNIFTDSVMDGSVFIRLGFTVLGSLLLFSLLGSFRREPFPPKSRPQASPFFSAAAILPVLTVLAAAYGLFVYVQFRYLFGGVETAQMAGGYAEYARKGFFQLALLAFLTLLLVFPVLHGFPQSKAVRMLSGLVTALTVVIDLSAFFRMRLYIQAFGFSVLRVVTLWGMLMVLLALGACMLKCAWPGLRVCPALTALALGSWLALNLCGIDRLTAKSLISAYNRGASSALDIRYLAHLTPDAAPELMAIQDEALRETALEAVRNKLGPHRPAAYDWCLSWLNMEDDTP